MTPNGTQVRLVHRPLESTSSFNPSIDQRDRVGPDALGLDRAAETAVECRDADGVRTAASVFIDRLKFDFSEEEESAGAQNALDLPEQLWDVSDLDDSPRTWENVSIKFDGMLGDRRRPRRPGAIQRADIPEGRLPGHGQHRNFRHRR